MSAPIIELQGVSKRFVKSLDAAAKVANVIGAGLCLLLANYVALLTTIRYALLAPFMIVLIFFAAFQATRDWQDLIALLVMGTLGCFMKRFGWSRPARLL